MNLELNIVNRHLIEKIFISPNPPHKWANTNLYCFTTSLDLDSELDVVIPIKNLPTVYLDNRTFYQIVETNLYSGKFYEKEGKFLSFSDDEVMIIDSDGKRIGFGIKFVYVMSHTSKEKKLEWIHAKDEDGNWYDIHESGKIIPEKEIEE